MANKRKSKKQLNAEERRLSRARVNCPVTYFNIRTFCSQTGTFLVHDGSTLSLVAKSPIIVHNNGRREAHLLVERHSVQNVSELNRSVPGADVIKRATHGQVNIHPGSAAHVELNGVSFGNKKSGKSNTLKLFASLEQMLTNLPMDVHLVVWFENLSRAIRNPTGEHELGRLIEHGRFRARFFGDDESDQALDPMQQNWRMNLKRLAAVPIARTIVNSVEPRGRQAAARNATISREIQNVQHEIAVLETVMQNNYPTWQQTLATELSTALTDPTTTISQAATAIENALARVVNRANVRKLLRKRSGTVRPDIARMLLAPTSNADEYDGNCSIDSKAIMHQFEKHMDQTIGDAFKTENESYNRGLMIVIGYGLPGSCINNIPDSQWETLHNLVWFRIRLAWLQGMQHKNNQLMTTVRQDFHSTLPDRTTFDQVVKEPSNNVFVNAMNGALKLFRQTLGFQTPMSIAQITQQTMTTNTTVVTQPPTPPQPAATNSTIAQRQELRRNTQMLQDMQQQLDRLRASFGRSMLFGGLPQSRNQNISKRRQ